MAANLNNCQTIPPGPGPNPNPNPHHHHHHNHHHHHHPHPKPKPGPGPCTGSCCGSDSPVSSFPLGTTSTSQSNSVMLATGEFIFSLDLLSAPAIGGGSWQLSLQYLSSNGVDDIVGMFWNYSQNYQLIQLPNGDIVLTTPENLQETFISNGNGQWLSGYNSTQATLVEINAGTANDTFILTSNAGTVTEFFGFYSSITTPGRMKSTTDRYGNSQTLTWTSTAGVPQLTSVADAYGRTTTYSYYNATYGYKCSGLTDFLGRQINFQYDSPGHLVAIILPSINNAAPGNTYPDGTAYVFQYDVNNSDPNRQNDLLKIWYPNQTQPYVSNRAVDVPTVYANATPRYVVTYGQSSGATIAYGAVVSETVGDPANGVGGTYTFSYSNTSLPANIIDPSDPIVSQTTMTDRNGNIKIFNFNYNGMVVMKQENTNRNKSSLEVGPYITWTQYNDQNQKLLEVFPAGDSMAYSYDTGMIDFGSGPQLYPPRRGLLLSETHFPGNSIGIPSRPGSNGQTQLTKTYFYDPIYNQVCAEINEKGNPIAINSGVNVYFTPQNGGTTPTDANRSRYATITTFDYQKNQTSTITGSSALQNLLGSTAAQIQSLITYANNQMIAGGLPSGFQTNLGDINGDGTGDGNSSGLFPAAMLGSVVEVQHPSVYQLVPSTGSTPWVWQTQVIMELYTNNYAGQTTTYTDPEGNLTVYVRYPENDPEGNGQYASTFLSNKQYGRLREVHVDADPSQVMDLVGEDGDLTSFSGSMIARVNTPGQYLDLVTRYEGGTGSAGCPTCAYDPLGNPLAVTDPNGNASSYLRTEMGEEYQRTGPAPYFFQTQLYYDSNRNTTRVDTQDQQVAYESLDPNDPDFAQFTASGNGSSAANIPMQNGPGGTIRPGWFTNLYTFDILDDRIQDDIDATGSNPASLVTSYSFDANQNTIQITKPNGNIVQFDYDERDLKIAQRIGYVAGSDPGSVSVSVFDANGDLLNVIGPAQRGTGNNSLSVTISNAFNSGSSLTQTGDWLLANTFDGFNRNVSATDSIGGVTSNIFDPTGQNIQRQITGTPNGPTPTDRNGNNNVPLELLQTRCDEAGRAYESQQSVFLNTGLASGVPTNNIPSGRTVTHTGGGLAANSTTNSNTSTVTLTTGGSNYVLTRTVFDRSNRSTASAMDNAAVSTTAYDGANRPILTTDTLGNTTATAFDNNGNPVSITRTELSTITQPAQTAEVFTTLMAWDCMNRQVLLAQNGSDGSISQAKGVNLSRITLTGYDSRSNVTLNIDPKGNTTVTLWDGASRTLETRQHLRQNGLGNNPPVSNGNGQSTTFNTSGQGQIAGSIQTSLEYDGNSNQIAMVDDRGGVTRWAFDSHDRKTSMTYHDGSTESFTYNTASNVVQFTDCNGSKFTNTWDPRSQKTSTTIAPASGIGGTTAQSFQYNGLSQTTFARDTANGNNADVTIVYDSIQRTIEEEQTYSGNTRYVTNDAFNSLAVSQFTFPNARQINNSLDKLYRRQQILETATSAVLASWQFFGPQRIAEVALGNGITQTTLNNARTHSAVQYNSVPNPAWGTPSSDRLGYDGGGRMIAKRYLSGGINPSTFAYNNTTPVVGNTTAFDPVGNKYYERALHAEDRSFLYQPVDNIGNIASPVPGFDSVDRLLQYQRGTLSSTGGYEGNGGGSVSAMIILYGAFIRETWTLDGLGNWRSNFIVPYGEPPGTVVGSYNKLNQAYGFKYDGQVGASNGNLVNDGYGNEYSFDVFNRLIQVNNSSTGSVLGSYVYDAFNRRIRKTVSASGLLNGTTDYIWMRWQVAEERNSSNAPIRQYIWGPYIDECIQLTTYTILGPQNLPAGTYYLLQDLLYRAVALTNSSGNIVETYDTDAYGNTLAFTGPGADGVWFTSDDLQSDYGANEIIFCGYRFDPESRLYYVRNRTYLPVLGRWLQRDPIGYAGGVNLYEFVGGRAAVAMDPTGTLVVPGMPIPLPMHGAGPLKFWRGAIHDLGRGADGKCRFYVNTHYSQDLGTILTNGWSPAGEDWQAYVAPTFDILAKLTEVGGLVNELLSGTTFDTALYAYEAKVSFIKTRVFTYTCCKRYQNPVWESTTVKNVHFSFWSLGSIQSANLNLLLPGSNERLIDAIKEWDAELLKHFILEVSP